jgi:nitrite reductase (cytochrome c-552)
MGFHAPQETARLLAEAIDHARQGELALLGTLPPPAPGYVFLYVGGPW